MTSARAILAVLTAAWIGAASAGEHCTATDGITLQCRRDSVRVEGLRAPDLREPGGPEARQRLQRRIQGGELVIERRGPDRFGRTLGRAYVNGIRITQLELSPNTRR